MADTQQQKDKKNKNRLLAKQRGFFPSIQKNYQPTKPKVAENQLKLI